MEVLMSKLDPFSDFRLTFTQISTFVQLCLLRLCILIANEQKLYCRPSAMAISQRNEQILPGDMFGVIMSSCLLKLFLELRVQNDYIITVECCFGYVTFGGAKQLGLMTNHIRSIYGMGAEPRHGAAAIFGRLLREWLLV